ncbi:MAG: hypothetical protein IPM98_10175 [Lewinellaceae bacterium]|nr:hypothetical protein [Lewinellaceae bacterium]
MNLERGQLYGEINLRIFVLAFRFEAPGKVQIAHAMPKNLKNIAMNTLERTFYEGVETGKLQGTLEGKLEGELLGIKKSIRQLLVHGYSPEQTAGLLECRWP